MLSSPLHCSQVPGCPVLRCFVLRCPVLRCFLRLRCIGGILAGLAYALSRIFLALVPDGRALLLGSLLLAQDALLLCIGLCGLLLPDLRRHRLPLGCDLPLGRDLPLRCDLPLRRSGAQPGLLLLNCLLLALLFHKLRLPLVHLPLVRLPLGWLALAISDAIAALGLLLIIQRRRRAAKTLRLPR